MLAYLYARRVQQSDINAAWAELWVQMEEGQKTVAEAIAEIHQVADIGPERGWLHLLSYHKAC